ncbi:M15 family metallopeptidase [Fictibacillus sp. WQ 8-8]|uniref:M15 family metallopeptidase n=1 Tax=Fictibacillus sp. WQ 8-8 TaxID=2938788 RepID=UPI002811957B|nr:M15 family metallopeptidase [Fictibacillus sp. WQ 8-8]
MSAAKSTSRLGSWLIFVVILGLLFYLYIDREKAKSEVPLPAKLHPAVEENKEKLIQRAKEKGISIVITDGFRSIKKQDELYEKGRTKEGEIVTTVKGGESYHNYGLAIDFALQTKEGDVVWDTERDSNRNNKPDWMEVVSIAKTLGFTWGGDWEFKDYPHLQMDFGLSMRDLKNGERPPKQG